MKKLFFTFFASITFISFFGQAPKEINYQGVARNSSGSLLSNQSIGIKLDLHQGSATGTIVFSESHNKTTNSFGLFTLGIGSFNTTGFTSINWANGPYFLEVSMDPAGGTSYSSVGTQQFLSVPYALYAETAGNSSSTPTFTNNGPTTIAGSYPNYTVNSVASPSTTLVQGNNVTLNNSGSTYTVSTPSYSISSGTGSISITNGFTTSSAPIDVPILSYTGSATSGTLQSGAQTVTIPNYTLSNTSNTITLNNGTANSTAIIPVPTLTLVGSTLQSGPTSNTVSLSAINNWSVTSGVIYPSTLTNSVGVGINSSLGGRVGISHTSSTTSPHINLISPTTSDFGRVKFSNTGSSSYFSFEARNNTGGLADAFNIAHNNGIDEKQVFLINGNRNVFINNLNIPLAAFHVMTHSSTPNGLAVEGFNKFGELIIARNNQTGLSGSRQPIFATNEIGRITFSGASSTVYPNEYTGGSANISVRATDNFAPTTQGSEMYFQTVPTGTNVSKDVMKLTQDGSVEVTNMLRIPYGVLASGKVLTSDAAGNASWQTLAAPAAAWTSTLGVTTLLNSSDNVGIGTNIPQSILHVETDGSLDKGLRVSNSNSMVNGPSIYLDGQNQDWSITGSNAGNGSGANKFVIRDYSNAVDRFVIDNTGNVGIGTTSPINKLHVNGSIAITDGSQGNEKILTSDATGKASWKEPNRTVYIKDVKANNTGGGSFTSGSWVTRTLNTIEGDASLITIAGNQITLQPGTYLIDIVAPAYRVDSHKAKLQNITDNTTDIVGTSEFSSNGGGGQAMTQSRIVGTIIISSPKVYEVQHRCSNSNPNGFGQPCGFGLDEIYTLVKIIKVK